MGGDVQISFVIQTKNTNSYYTFSRESLGGNKKKKIIKLLVFYGKNNKGQLNNGDDEQ